MYIESLGIAISRTSKAQLFARPRRVMHETPVDHLPPTLTLVNGPATPTPRRRQLRTA